MISTLSICFEILGNGYTVRLTIVIAPVKKKKMIVIAVNIKLL